MSKPADLIIKNAKIWTENSKPCLPDDAAIVIGNGRILEIGAQEELEQNYQAASSWDAGGKLLLPGFINTHNHLFQTFMRGLGKDLTFLDWMNKSVRLLMPHMDGEAVYLAAMSGCLEALRTGTTTLLDFMYANTRPNLCDEVVRAFEDCGIRGILAHGLTDVDKLPGSDVPPSTYAPVADSLADIDRLQAKYQNNDRISFMLAPSVMWCMTFDGLKQITQYAREKDMVVTMHLQETVDDDNYSMELYGKRTTRALEDSGILETKFLAVHAVRMEQEDFDLFRQYNVGVSYNPVANMILGSGVAPIDEMLKLGLNIALGTDGAASNDSQNLIEVMKSGALLQKAYYHDTSMISSGQIFSMATDMGAAAIHMQDDIGSLAPGKRADMVVVDMERPNTTPFFDPISSLVYSGSEGNIDSVFVDGKLLFEHGSFCQVDEHDVLRRAQEKARELYYTANGK